jgi:hypothetical protein
MERALPWIIFLNSFIFVYTEITVFRENIPYKRRRARGDPALAKPNKARGAGVAKWLSEQREAKGEE